MYSNPTCENCVNMLRFQSDAPVVIGSWHLTSDSELGLIQTISQLGPRKAELAKLDKLHDLMRTSDLSVLIASDKCFATHHCALLLNDSWAYSSGALSFHVILLINQLKCHLIA